MNIRKLRILQVYVSCRSCLFFIPILFPFLDNQGVGEWDRYILMGITMAVAVLLEIPSGMFADRFGTKLTLVLSSFVSAITLLIFPLFYSFTGMIIPHIGLGIAFACDSGTLEAYVHDSVEGSNYKKTFGRLMLFGMAGVITILLGGPIAKNWTYATPFLLTSGFHFIAFLFALALPSISKKGTRLVTYHWRQLTAIKEYYPLILFVAVGMFTAYVIQDFLTLESVAVDIFWFGVIIAALRLFYVLGGFVASKIKTSSIIVIVITLLSIPLAISGLFPAFWSIICFWSIAITHGLLNVVIDSKLMSTTTNKASIVSIKSIIIKIYFAGILLSFGLIVGLMSIPSALVVLSLITVIWVILFRRVFTKM